MGKSEKNNARSEIDGKKLTEHIKTAYKMPGGKELFRAQVPLDAFKSSYQATVQKCSEHNVAEIDANKELKNTDRNYGL